MPAQPLVEFSPLPLPDIPPASEGWGLRLEVMLQRFLIGTLNLVGRGLQTIFAWGLTNFLEGVEDSLINVLGDNAQELIDDPDVPEEIKGFLRAMLSGEHQGAVSMLSGFGAQLGMSAASGFLAPFMRLLNYAIDRKKRTARMDPNAAIATVWRYGEAATVAAQGLQDLGWTDDMIGWWTGILAPQVPEGDMLTLWLRGELDEEAMDLEFTRRGWEQERIARLKMLRQVIPGVQDLISMAVREAFNESVIERFGYAENIPAEAAEWAEKQGLSAEWFRRYWVAHWQLPSVQMGFEMLHRLRPGVSNVPFTLEDMRTLLTTQDIAPFFRERLIELSYSPFTRVDLRRMWKIGILTREQVHQGYLDLGYTEEKAEALTEFAIFEETSGEREITRSMVERGFKRGLMTYDISLQVLKDMGYREEDAEFILSIAEFDLAQEHIDDELDRVGFLYTEGEISESQIYDELGPLNLPTEQIANLIVKWNTAIRKKVSLPSKGDLEEWYGRDLITADELRQGMLKRRYVTTDIDLYVQNLDAELAEKAAREAERAQAEQERIEKAEFKTETQRLKAAKDVQLAQARLQIADLKYAVNFMVTDEEKSDAKEEILALKADIAALQLEKAEIKYERT